MKRWRAVLAISVIAGASVLLAACRLAGSMPAESASPSGPGPSEAASATDDPSPSGFVAVEAPEACGFPPGTPLEFAGRSTTATLNVQEVVGDPMSDDPADIYVTAEPIDYGGTPGRVVCAIYVNDPGFVEITMHPDDVGKFTPLPTPTLPPGVSEADAIVAARTALPNPDEWEIDVIPPGPIENLYSEWESHQWARSLSASDWIWPISAVRGDQGVAIFVDYVDGSVLGTIEYVLPSPGGDL